MARRQQQPEIVNELTSEDDLERVRARDYPKLVIVDVYLTWCGPCEVMKPNFRTMYFEYEDPQNRIELYQMDSTLITEPTIVEALGEITCKPKYIVFAEGEIKGVVEGADYTKIKDLADKYIPGFDQD